ncbi:PAS domain S-box protein [Paenibacillus endoradicis]|uniref:PAS domain S-box protein n=1 Tax=Paenibacillus endoradicis TaxID=2972487 RepID=UPI002158FBB9|nr:PAS domain S-box protein [Paenibacillus endoradicis]MCR8660429.1 PAS domain S-box protein [Paenibacillus endoradicis]
MSIKYKLSITIAVLLSIVIAVFHYAWGYNQQSKNYDLIYRSSFTLSERIHQDLDFESPTFEQDLNQIYHFVRVGKPYLLDVVFYNTTTNEIVYSASHYATADTIIAKEKYNSKYLYQFLEVSDQSDIYYISDYRYNLSSELRIITIYNKDVYNQTLGDNNSLFYATLIYLVFFSSIISYWFIGRMLQPLKDILWKVNEVSSVRFHRPIPITTRDEFGLLAFKINAMSQNLSIYMNKLRTAFDENRRMRLYMESFINHSTDAIYIMDLDGTMNQMNNAFEQLFGYTEAEVIGRRYLTVPEHLIKEKEDIFSRIHSGEIINSFETLRSTKDGDLIPVSITITPIRDYSNTITGFASVCRDMRHRNQMEELMRRSEKLNMVGQLAAGVAHEIRNPLTTLRGFLQLQKQSKKLNIDHVHVMLSELDRINLIVGEFLILAKPQAVKFKVRDVRDILAEVTSLMGSEALLHNVTLKETYTKDDCRIPCEENQLKQVFINVLKNGIEAMPYGGHVHIAVLRSDQAISVHITDEGIGMEEETLKRIGDPFFTVKENGTGLGIMVSQKIIETHHGQMELTSQVNVGTTVKILLPAYQEEELADASSL